ncbi:MAG: sulfatase [Acidobacteriota bacterium]
MKGTWAWIPIPAAIAVALAVRIVTETTGGARGGPWHVARATEPVTIADETRPAIPLGRVGFSISVPRTAAGVDLTFAFGVRAPARRIQHQMIVAHETPKTPASPPPPAPEPRPTAPQGPPAIAGTYLLRVSSDAGVLREDRLGPGPPRWVEHRIPVDEGTVRFELEATGSAPGEQPFLGDPTLTLRGQNDARQSAILISVDSLRADHVGAYGSPAPVTPHVDRLSRRARLYEMARTTAPWTMPAHQSILASRYGSELGALDPGSAVDRSVPTLAMAARRGRCDTWARVNHLLVGPGYGFDRGFAVFRFVQNGTAASSVREALARLDASNRRASFVFLHLFDVHMDYTPAAPFTRLTEESYSGVRTGHMVDLLPYFKPENPLPAEDLRHVAALYDAELAATDLEIGVLSRGLSRNRRAGRTVVCLTADHGEELKEHGSLGHGATLWEEQLRVPLFFADGGPARLSGEAASLLDVAPTLASYLGLPPERSWRGRDLSGPRVPSCPALAENQLFERDLTAEIAGDAKRIATWEGATPSFVALDLGRDGREVAPTPASGAPYASWLRNAFRPGIHIVTRRPGLFAPGAEPDPHVAGLSQLFRPGDEGHGTRVAPSSVYDVTRREWSDPLRLDVDGSLARTSTDTLSDDDLENLRALGYVK